MNLKQKISLVVEEYEKEKKQAQTKCRRKCDKLGTGRPIGDILPITNELHVRLSIAGGKLANKIREIIS